MLDPPEKIEDFVDEADPRSSPIFSRIFDKFWFWCRFSFRNLIPTYLAVCENEFRKSYSCNTLIGSLSDYSCMCYHLPLCAGGPVAKPSGFDSRRRFHGGPFLPWGRKHASGPPCGLRAMCREAERAHRRRLSAVTSAHPSLQKGHVSRPQLN